MYNIGYFVVSVMQLTSVLFCRFALSGKWPVCCIGSMVSIPCGVNSLSTYVTGCTDIFRLFVVVGVRVISLPLLIFPAMILLVSICCFSVFNWRYFCVISWILTVLARRFEFYSICISGILVHSIHLQLIKSFQVIWWCDNWFICAVLQVGLLDRLLSCGGILAYMNLSFTARAAISNIFSYTLGLFQETNYLLV